MAAFATAASLVKERLSHVELTVSEPIGDSLVTGNGRRVSFGLWPPVEAAQCIHGFMIQGGLAAASQPTDVARALRRAAMAKVQGVLGDRERLPAFFCGHEPDGSPARTERSSHLTFVFDPGPARLLIIAPHVLDRRASTREENQHLRNLYAALTGFRELRAGSAGCLQLHTISIHADSDPLVAPSRNWESATPYQVTRHMKRVSAAEALASDLHAECRRCGLPDPHVTSRELRGVPGVGLIGSARLTFEVAVKGPIILGRSRHLGGGLFVGTRWANRFERSSRPST